MEREITAIKPQKRNHQRVNIYLDGEYAFGLSRFVAGWLTTGRKLNQAEIEKLKKQDAYEIAFQKALQFINFRPRSVHETRKRLSEKGFGDEVIEVTIQKLLDKKWLDDLDFARQWIENRNAFRPRSDRLLAYELRLKGVAEDKINIALEKYGENENLLAYKAGIKKATQCQNKTKIEFQKKVGGFLSRRGFAYAIVKPTVEKLWNEFSSPTEAHRDQNIKNGA